MLQNQNTTPEDTKKSYTNALSTLKEESFSNIYEHIENTNFAIAGNEILGYFITYSKYRISDAQRTKEEAINLLETNKWQIIENLICIIIEILEDKKN